MSRQRCPRRCAPASGCSMKPVVCMLPGCPSLETVIAFWTEGDRRHHFKVFKPVEEVADEDLPPSWLNDTLALAEGVECACC